jgi:hypothetical protein
MQGSGMVWQAYMHLTQRQPAGWLHRGQQVSRPQPPLLSLAAQLRSGVLVVVLVVVVVVR